MSANPNVLRGKPACGHRDCPAFVCRFENTANDYANAKIKADQLRGYPEQPERDERAPDGRRIY